MFSNIPKSIDNIIKPIIKTKEYVLATFSLVLAFVFFFVVILRYLFQADLFAYEEWILIVAFWVYFLGGAMGSYENTHVKADFLISLIDDPKKKWIVTNTTLLIEILICIVLTYWGWLMLYEEIEAYPNWQTTTGLQLPFVLPKLGIFVGFLLMTLYSSLHLYSALRSGPPAASSAAKTSD